MISNYIKVFLVATVVFIKSGVALSDEIVANFKGGVVKESQVMKKFAGLLDPNQFKGKKFSDLDNTIQDSMVRNYLADLLVSQEAKVQKVEQTSLYKKKLASIKEQLPKDVLIEQVMMNSVSDKQIDSEYEKYVDSLKNKKRVKVSHILLSDEKTAKEVKSKLNKGGNFVELCKQYSIDQNSKANECSLGIVNEGQVVPEFEKVAFSMKVGSISGPVKTQFGWHIIKLDDKLDVIIPKKELVINSIKDSAYKKAIEKYISDLFLKFEVKVTIPSKGLNTKK